MKQALFMLPFILLGALFLPGSSVAKAGRLATAATPAGRASSFEANAACSDQLEALDFSPALAGLTLGPAAGGPPFGAAALPEYEAPSRELTAGEQRIAYGFGYTSTLEGSYVHQSTALLHFYLAQGRLPATGAELAQSCWFTTLNDPLKIDSFLACTPEMQLRKILCQVNAVTGRLHSTYTDGSWHPGGIYARPLSDLEFASLKPFVSGVFKEHGERPSAALALTFFGEQEGAVLVRDYVTYSWPSGSRFTEDPRIILPGLSPGTEAPPPAQPGASSEDPLEGKGHC